MGGFIAQLVEHYTGIAEVTGSNSVEALIRFTWNNEVCYSLGETPETQLFIQGNVAVNLPIAT